jgi:hypothetical protein
MIKFIMGFILGAVLLYYYPGIGTETINIIGGII